MTSSGYVFFDATLFHQVEEALFIRFPVAAVFFVLIEHVFGGRQIGQMDVPDFANLFQKIGQIIALGEPCQLRHIIQPHIDNALRTRFAQSLEEFLRILSW